MKNIYKHTIDLRKLRIKNLPKEEFAKELEKIPYLGYEVETISDGTKIVISKPDGKRSAYGQIKKEDYFVFVYNPIEETLWQISHPQIKKDLISKGEHNTKEAIKIIDALEKVFYGEEPDEVLKKYSFVNTIGILPETLLKCYKWIWGQEDVNYPGGLGREMVWFGKEKQGDKILETGDGIFDLKNELIKKISE